MERTNGQLVFLSTEAALRVGGRDFLKDVFKTVMEIINSTNHPIILSISFTYCYGYSLWFLTWVGKLVKTDDRTGHNTDVLELIRTSQNKSINGYYQ